MSIRDELKGHWRLGGALKRILFINIAVFLCIHLVGFVNWISGGVGLIGEEEMLQYLMGGSSSGWLLHKPWTVITYMFTHHAPVHILWNMLLFWFSGQLFQGMLGERRLVGNYILGGLIGFGFYLLGKVMPGYLHLASEGPILGASAAVMSVFIGIAAYQPDQEVGLMLAGRVRLKYVAIVVLILDLIGIKDGDNTGGHLAHLGGALYGFMAARQLRRNDWSLGFVNALDRTFAFIKPRRGPRMRVEKTYTRSSRHSDAHYNAAKRDKQARVDAILDKISRSGYDSLSKEEKDLLFKAGNG